MEDEAKSVERFAQALAHACTSAPQDEASERCRRLIDPVLEKILSAMKSESAAMRAQARRECVALAQSIARAQALEPSAGEVLKSLCGDAAALIDGPPLPQAAALAAEMRENAP